MLVLIEGQAGTYHVDRLVIVSACWLPVTGSCQHSEGVRHAARGRCSVHMMRAACAEQDTCGARAEE